MYRPTVLADRHGEKHGQIGGSGLAGWLNGGALDDVGACLAGHYTSLLFGKVDRRHLSARTGGGGAA